VTIIVYRDWSTRCTGHTRYVENLDKEEAKMLRRKAKEQGRNLRCEDPLDYRETDYRDRLVTQHEAVRT
jgi:hypothetical protein